MSNLLESFELQTALEAGGCHFLAVQGVDERISNLSDVLLERLLYLNKLSISFGLSSSTEMGVAAGESVQLTSSQVVQSTQVVAEVRWPGLGVEEELAELSGLENLAEIGAATERLGLILLPHEVGGVSDEVVVVSSNETHTSVQRNNVLTSQLRQVEDTGFTKERSDLVRVDGVDLGLSGCSGRIRPLGEPASLQLTQRGVEGRHHLWVGYLAEYHMASCARHIESYLSKSHSLSSLGTQSFLLLLCLVCDCLVHYFPVIINLKIESAFIAMAANLIRL